MRLFILIALALAAFPLGAQTATRQVDVAIVLDSSGSMGTSITQVKANVAAFVESLGNSNLNAAYTVVRYANGSNTDGQIMNGGNFYTNYNTFKSQALDPVVATYGMAHGLDALANTMQNLAWRSSALKTIILITDTRDEGSSTSETTVRTSLVNGGFILHTVTTNDPLWERLRVATSGSKFSLQQNFGAILDAIVGQIGDSYFDILATVEPAGAGSVSGTGEYALGSPATLIAAANTTSLPYFFLEWRENGAAVSTTPTYVFNVPGDRSLVAVFDLPSYQVTAVENDPARGSVQGSALVRHGDAATLTATANPGFVFRGWEVDGLIVSGSAVYTFPVTKVLNAKAVFKIQATVTVASNTSTYNGNPKTATATTSPAGMPLTFEYAGIPAGQSPVNAGTYAVTAIAENASHYGTGSGTLVISKASQTITFASLLGEGQGNEVFLGATASSGLNVIYASSNPGVATIRYEPNGQGVAVIHGPGTTFITASQPGDQNFLPALPEQRVLAIGELIAADDFYQIPAGSTAPYPFDPTANDGGNQDVVPVFNPQPGTRPSPASGGGTSYPIPGDDGRPAGNMVFNPTTGTFVFHPAPGYRGIARFTYRLSTLPDAYEQRISAPPPSTRFGKGMVVRGDFAVIGDTSQKKLYTYTRNGVTKLWTYTGNSYAYPGIHPAEFFGYSLAFDGDLLVVGSPGYLGTTGSAFVYQRSGNGLTFVQQLTTDGIGMQGTSEFGSAVAIMGDRIVVGAPNNFDGTKSTGAVFLYRKNATTGQWGFSRRVWPSEFLRQAGERFGETVAIVGDEIFVGAPGRNEHGPQSGRLFFFKDFGFLTAMFNFPMPPSVERSDRFGTSVAAHGNLLAVGSPRGGENDVGAVYLYEKVDGAWEFSELFESQYDDYNSAMGSSVALTDGMLVAGAPNSGKAASWAGATYLFRKEGEGWDRLRLSSGLPGASRYWGTSVAVDDGTLLVGETASTNHRLYFIDMNIAFGPRSEVVIQIGPPNVGPQITSTVPVSDAGNVRFTHQVAVTDPDDGPFDLSYSLENAPRGMIITAYGKIIWYPATGATSSGDVTVVVRDGGGNGAVAASQTFRVDLTSPGVFRYAFFPMDEVLYNSSLYYETNDVADLSDDGTVVAGNMRAYGPRFGGYLWSRHGGLTVLPKENLTSNVETTRFISSLSGDGSVAGTFSHVGNGWVDSYLDYEPGLPLLWQRGIGFRRLGHPHPNVNGYYEGGIDGMSRTGDWAVGQLTEWWGMNDYGDSAAYWAGVYRAELFATGDHSSAGSGFTYRATDVSADGSIVVGERHAFTASGVTEKTAVRWDNGVLQEMQNDPALTGFQSVHAVSNSGYEAVGSIGDQAVLWRYGYAYPLPGLAGTTGRTVATALSDQADKTAGYRETATGDRAIFTFSDIATFDLQTEMATNGVVLGDYKLSRATSLSGDGTILIGNGLKYGDDCAWMVELLDSTLFPPIGIAFAGGNAWVTENQAPGAVVGTLETQGGLVGEIYTYELIPGEEDNGFFALAGANGDEVVTTASFDYETRSQYYIKVRTVNSVGAETEAVLTISIGNVHEPAAITVTVQPAGEGSATGARIYDHGETARLVASPAVDFIEWLEDGIRVSANPSYQFSVNRPRDLTARFKAVATVVVADAAQEYAGVAAGISVSTVPAGLAYAVLYNGNAQLPDVPGEFPFTVTIQDTNYKGTASGVFELKQSQSIAFPDPGTLVAHGASVPLLASATSGLVVDYSSSNPGVAEIVGNRVQPVSAGVATLTASQTGNAFFAAAVPVEIVVTVIPNSSGFDQILFASPPVPANLWQPTGSAKWIETPAGSGVLATGPVPSGATSGLSLEITGPFRLQWNWRLLAADSHASLRVNGEIARSISADPGTWASDEISLGDGIWSLEWRFENTGATTAVAGELAGLVITYGAQPVAQPVVTQVSVAQIPGTHLVEITYDLSDADSQAAYIWLQGSFDSGAAWHVPMHHVRGDVGPGVATGTGRRVIWEVAKDFPLEFQHATMRLRVVAHDYPDFRPVGWAPVIHNQLARIPYGGFQMGNSGAAAGAGAWPSREVHLKPYSIGIEEITNQQVVDVYNWAINNGHFDWQTGLSLNQGDLYIGNFSIFGQRFSTLQITVAQNPTRLQLVNPAGQSTAAYAHHPCAEITRYGAMLYCHYRSLMEGLQSPYTPSTFLTYWPLDMTRTGYRLPTEAEWEKAARGGNGTAFPWGDTATHSQANYLSSSSPYNAEPATGLHPAYATYPLQDGTKTAPVSAFAANAYGLRQMIGNVKEWCWDLSPPDYSATSMFDPMGLPVYEGGSEPHFVVRGGSWAEPLATAFSRESARSVPFIGAIPNTFGFRIARSEAFGSLVTSADFAVDTRASILISPPVKLTDASGNVGAGFGRSLSTHGDRVLIGTVGKAMIHELQPDETWLPTASLPIPSGETPRSLSLGESHAAIATSEGVEMFARQPDGSWPLEATLLVPASADAGLTTTYSEFGSAVAIDGSRLAVARIVGIADVDGVTTISERVEALIFERQPDESWLYQTKVTVFQAAPEFRTGTSLALQGGTLALGSHRQVTTFARDGSGNWNESATLQPVGVESEGFGSSIDLDDGWLAVNSRSGISMFREAPVGTWMHHQELATPTTLPGDAAVGVSGDVAFAGGGGKVWIWRLAVSGQWFASGPLSAFDGSRSAGFGAAVGLVQDWVLVGDPLDYQMGTGSGSVYALRLAAAPIPAQVQVAAAMDAAGLVGAAALPNATPFNDGVGNLLKFAFNMDLTGPDVGVLTTGGSSGLPQISFDTSGAEPVLRVEFLRRKGSGLIYTPQRSSSLLDFEAMTGIQTVTSINAEWERVSVEEPVAPDTAPSAFARVRVSLP